MSTIKDVARLTGLSISTISKYINGGNVLEKNRVLIESAIQKLDFRVNQAARSLKTNKTMTVGVLLPSLDVSFFANIITEIEYLLLDAGYFTVVCSYNHDPRQEMRKLCYLIEKNVDAVLMVPEYLGADEIMKISEIRNHTTPLVLLDRAVEGLYVDCVMVDNVRAAYQATCKLIRAGHRRIGIVLGPAEISTARERLQGFLQAHTELAVAPDPECIRQGDYSLESGHAIFGELMDMPNRPSAVLATNYDMTLGAVTAAYERKLRIPEDVSFIGYDEARLSRIVSPPIDIVTQPTHEMAEQTTALLLERLRSGGDTPKRIRLECGMLNGQSVAPFPAP